MNKLISKELSKCKVARIPSYDDNTTTLHIAQGSKEQTLVLQPKHKYKIHVEDYVVHPFESYTIHTNWNNSVAPVDDTMVATVLSIVGKMTQIEGVGESNIPWTGWLPSKAIITAEEVL